MTQNACEPMQASTPTTSPFDRITLSKTYLMRHFRRRMRTIKQNPLGEIEHQSLPRETKSKLAMISLTPVLDQYRQTSPNAKVERKEIMTTGIKDRHVRGIVPYSEDFLEK